MRDILLTIAYTGLAMCFVFACIWATARDYKYGGNPNTRDAVVIVEVNQDSLDWEDFTRALIWVESRGDSKAVGSNNDIGVLQITPVLVEDCNRIVGYDKYDLDDRLDSLRSVEMFNVIQDHYNPQHDYHWALKIWNSRAPLSYHRKVMDKFNEIKEARP